MLGIGGCGMSGLARLLAARGIRVGGSDETASDVTRGLEAEGIVVRIGKGSVPADAVMVIASAAIPDDHPELVDAQSRGIRCSTYAEALGMAQSDRLGVSIAGTHGKSTTAVNSIAPFITIAPPLA